MKNEIIMIITDAGFKESGKNQYYHPIHGRLFMKEYTSIELVSKLMDLGKVHLKHILREILEVPDNTTFNPQA